MWDMANKRIESSKQAFILAALSEGMAIDSVCRMFKVGKNAVLRVIQETGGACGDWRNRHFRNLTIERLELNEQWAYVHTHKERMTREVSRDNPGRGDCWLWASLDPDSKAIVNWRTGKRTIIAAREFAADLASRVPGQAQITSDQLQSYKYTIPSAFEGRADYAQEHMIFQKIKVDGPHWQMMRVNPLVGLDPHFPLQYGWGSRIPENHASRQAGHCRQALDFRRCRSHNERHIKAQEEKAFEQAFEGFVSAPRTPRAYDPQAPLISGQGQRRTKPNGQENRRSIRP